MSIARRGTRSPAEPLRSGPGSTSSRTSSWSCAPRTRICPIHASWHPVELDVGPYRLTGELPTLPGFDPGRALSRPGGPFVLLRDVRLDLVGHPEGGSVERRHAFVNRYAVERVAADIELGFYFPGATFLTAGGRPLS